MLNAAGTKPSGPKPGAVRQPGAIRRCAIYTRKSSEEGLEQAFNSLDAQREACEAYIASQRHEGWMALPTLYDDGGFSGGSMERPALQQLLRDIRERRVDLVVVYKVDRLTRSLADFAKIVDVFDAQGISFVSVTQQFNTTTSMGRLTLNMLLSFAQFEREVTGERIRDKIAASKRKGMWMGGYTPLGYVVRDRKLVIDPVEAATVRHVFQSYLALGSVRKLRDHLAADGTVSKRRVSPDGKVTGGLPITRGNLYQLLGNRLYRGEVVHKGVCHPGEHDAIIALEVWDAVQARLAGNTQEREDKSPAVRASLLTGMLFDEAGKRLVPTHATKAGRRYRYYVSQALLTGGKAKDPTGRRIPARDIERLVTDRLGMLLTSHTELLAILQPHATDVARQQHLLHRAAAVATEWDKLASERRHAITRRILARVEIRIAEVAIELRPSEVLQTLLAEPNAKPSPHRSAQSDEPTHTIVVGAALRRAGLGMRLVIDGAPTRVAPDDSLLALIRNAHGMRERLLISTLKTTHELAAQEKVGASYYSRVVRLGFLAPDIVTSILAGRQPVGLTAAKLLQDSRLPVDWSEQRRVLGFPAI